jgi:outer membrane receptor protein involved in Fe transport
MKRLISCMQLLVALLMYSAAFSQTSVTVTGHIKNSKSGEKLPAVSITIKGGDGGTFTDENGVFKLVTVKPLPFTIIISSIGYANKEVEVTAAGELAPITLDPSFALGQDIVVAASRVPERILESPVSIERVGTSTIRNTPATSYYDIVKTLKGVDVTSSSLTFTSVTTRGFNGSGNTRVNQFVDGMDNQAPGLNFSVGAVVGLTELDVESMELLPGASSALYGSGGMNGTLLINSKNPFKYQGFSAQVKTGVNHVGGGGTSSDPVGVSPYTDISMRWGQKVSNRFAFKIGAQFIKAKDWLATDESNYTGAGTGSGSHVIAGTRLTDPNYEGVNVYGDETSANMLGVTNSILGYASNQFATAVLQQNGVSNPTSAQISAFINSNPAVVNNFLATNTNTAGLYKAKQAGIIPNQNVSRTGYKENEFIDNNTIDIKLSGGLYYKLNPGTEMSLVGNYGTGNTVYTGSDRYSLKNLKIGQYKFEIKNDKWFVKAYATLENSGDAFNATIAAQLFNERWKPSSTWYQQYLGGYLQTISTGGSASDAHLAARKIADNGRPEPGSSAFRDTLNKVISLPIPKGGRFLDKTNLFHFEGQYNLSSVVKFAEVLVGGSYRVYRLNSQGTLFADSTGPINTGELGAYIQVSKKLFDDKLKLTASGRYDKNDNFKGKFTPRISAVIKVAEDQNIRLSYQNAYRFPSNQNQWINLNTGAGILIGGLPQLRSFYNFDTKPVYTIASVQAYKASGDPSVLVQQTFGTYKPETVNSYEVGYKGLFNKRFLLDVYGYYTTYKDFIGRVSAYQLATGTGFSISVNSPNTVHTKGFGIGTDYLLTQTLSINANLSSDVIDNPDPNFATYFNTPKYRANIGLGNSGFGPGKLFGFNVQWRWQDTYYTEADFKQGDVRAFSTIDAQVSYKLPKIKSLIKLGGTNILNHYYTTAFGNPSIGALYYISFGYNVF